jgi:hypothetical protein
MIELPTFYGWLLRVSGLAIIVILFYLNKYAVEKHPAVSKYIITPLVLLFALIELVIFLITQ